MTPERIPQFSQRLSACTSSILANRRSCALFLDVDGTLLDLAATPRSVRVPDGLIGILQRLTVGLDGAIAVISGRLISEIDQLLAPLKLVASGVHGTELRRAPEREIERVTAALPPDVVQSMRKLALSIPGVITEPKGAGLAVHYRLVPTAQQEILVALEASLEAHAGAFEILPGKRLFEIVPSGLSKGTGLAALSALPQFRDRIPIMIGDDIGDEAAFAVAESRNGFALRVAGEHYDEDEADFAGPGAVVNWLDQLARRLTRIERPRAQP
ncbi:trehalose-phosphatase [uncultured Hyphomicrobium sp.]|uniref:trehalose-phosphatase n=1 Tax=uncultured Hyphomicrobium sp. TaxID=194373 RepID=UPI0025FDC683|nr:trehalose-phosphatase [uncultured Hyphomicrobium sp.]